VSRDALSSFQQNCGVGPLEFDLRPADDAPPRRLTFDQPFVVIGRAAGADLQVDGVGVGQRHAYMQAIGGRVFAVDLESRTGLIWPGGPRPAGWLHADQPVRLGSAEICLRSTAPRSSLGNPADPLLSIDADPQALSRTVFEVGMGTESPVRWRVNRPLTLVGRAGPCKLRLRDLRVSGFHCSLVAGPLGVWAVDLLSREGIWHNGERVRWTLLANGDRLEIGPFLLRVVEDEPAPAMGEVAAARVGDRRPVPVKAPQPFTPRATQLVSAPPAGAIDPARLAMEKSLLLPVIDQFNQMQQQMFDQFHQSILTMAQMFSTMHKEQMTMVREEMDHLRRITAELQELQAQKAQSAQNGAEAKTVATVERKSAQVDVGERPAAVPAWDLESKAPAEATANAGAADVHDWLSQRIASLQEERQGRWQKVMKFVMGR
jgi:pSer/pThr/pTyr-binding forkhead associated (FHA) protein